MSVIERQERRARGRPQARPDAATRHVIAEAARHAFTTCGFAGTNMDAVAKLAGVSKKTLYRLVPTKADLFKASVTDRIQAFLLAADVDALCALDLQSGLERILREFGSLTMSDETIAIQKLVIAESDRFPELASTFYAEAIEPTRALIADYLRRQCERGSLALEDPQLAAGMLRGMMIMEPQRAAMMGQRPAPTAAQIAERARACARTFLRGSLPGGIGTRSEPPTHCAQMAQMIGAERSEAAAEAVTPDVDGRAIR